MTEQSNNRSDTIVLETGLFQDRETVARALAEINIPESNRVKMEPESMNDRNWDNLLSLVLSAKRVITV